MVSLPERLRWAREIAGISQRHLSKLAGLKSEQHVRLIEVSEKPQNLGIETVSALAGALGVTIDWLHNGIGPEPTAEAIRESVAAAQARLAEQPNGSAA
jgi:transcriptional regulator with XRE-family HTH domain